jgi:ribosome-binding protein aMBF1 (putative translation factor)
MSDENTTEGAGADKGTETKAPHETVEYWRQRSQRFEGQLTEREKAAKAWEGLDPEVVKGKLEDYDKMRRERVGADPAELEALIAEEKKKIEGIYSGKLTETETKAQKLERELKELRVNSAVKEVALSMVERDSIELIKPFIDRDCEWQDGEIVVKDDNGEPRRSPNDPKRLMTKEEYVEELITKFPSIALDKRKRGTMTGGTGQPANGASGGTNITLEQFSQMTQEQRAKLPPKQMQDLSYELTMGRKAKGKVPFGATQ